MTSRKTRSKKTELRRGLTRPAPADMNAPSDSEARASLDAALDELTQPQTPKTESPPRERGGDEPKTA